MVLNPLEILSGYDCGSFLNEGLDSCVGKEWESIFLWMERDWVLWHILPLRVALAITQVLSQGIGSGNLIRIKSTQLNFAEGGDHWRSTVHLYECVLLANKPGCVGAHVRYDVNSAYRNVLNVQPTRHFDVFHVWTYYLFVQSQHCLYEVVQLGHDPALIIQLLHIARIFCSKGRTYTIYGDAMQVWTDTQGVARIFVVQGIHVSCNACTNTPSEATALRVTYVIELVMMTRDIPVVICVVYAKCTCESVLCLLHSWSMTRRPQSGLVVHTVLCVTPTVVELVTVKLWDF
jgi:hypothetical protein